MTTNISAKKERRTDFNYLLACFLGVAFDYYELLTAERLKEHREINKKVAKPEYRKRKISLHISQNKCTGCEDCFERCPHQVIGMVYREDRTYATVEYANKCVGCGKCVHSCKEDAIELNISNIY